MPDKFIGETQGILYYAFIAHHQGIFVICPLAKTLIKGYLTLTDMVKEFSAEAQEQVSDLVAEVKAERTADLAAAGAAGATHAAGKSKPSS